MVCVYIYIIYENFHSTVSIITMNDGLLTSREKGKARNENGTEASHRNIYIVSFIVSDEHFSIECAKICTYLFQLQRHQFIRI